MHILFFGDSYVYFITIHSSKNLSSQSLKIIYIVLVAMYTILDDI